MNHQPPNHHMEKIVDILEIYEQNLSRAQGAEAIKKGATEEVREEGSMDKASFGEEPREGGFHASCRSVQLQPANSLALLGRYSIQNVLPIPRTMLSRSEDAFQSQDQQYQQKQINESSVHMSRIEDELINTLDLGDLVTDRLDAFATENTKNVLRNFGNAQNHYTLYHHKARQYLEQNLSSTKEFDEWIRSLKLQNFVNFKKAWSGEESKLFARVYKKVCWQFYTENAIPYVLSSRIKKSQTRTSHLRYIFRFLEGLQNPDGFTYFRKS